MDEQTQKRFTDVLNTLIPGNDIEIHSPDDLVYSPIPALRELREIAELIDRLSKGDRS